MENNTNKKPRKPLKESMAFQQFIRETNNDHSCIGVSRCAQCGDYIVRFENINRCLSCQRTEFIKK